jgi:hypothetical protein
MIPVYRKQFGHLADARSRFVATLSPPSNESFPIVDLETGRELLAIPSGAGLVRQIAWSPDGSILLARMDEGRAWIIPSDSKHSTPER